MTNTKQSSLSWFREKDLSLHRRGFRWLELSPVRRTSYPMPMIILWRMGMMSVPLYLDDVANGVAKPWSVMITTMMVVSALSPWRWRSRHYWRVSSANYDNNEWENHDTSCRTYKPANMLAMSITIKYWKIEDIIVLDSIVGNILKFSLMLYNILLEYIFHSHFIVEIR